mmetsp:Transcript_40310/g.72021  ORF Transcript_40310/g.72021 Transcript_40310/m.72021 type:complete len:334 (-) Transcript_40310:1504-2505(-)
MSKKPPPKKAPPPGLSEEDPVKDLKKFCDAYIKLCDKNNVQPCQSVVKKFKGEIQAYNDGERIDPPNFPIIVPEPMDFASVRMMTDCLHDYRWLHQLSFWKAKVGDDGLMVIAEFLQKDKRLKTLELLNNNIGVRGCNYLGKVLTQNDTLVNLILDHNDIGDEGVAMLGDGLKWNSTVAYLSMQYCNIGAAGGEAIAKYIIRSSSVQELYLKGNSIGTLGVIAISQALAKNTTLTKLDLSDNTFGIDIEAIEALRDGIESNESLTWLDLHLNSMVPTGAAMLLEVLKNKPTILEFRIYERTSEALFRDVIDTVNTNIKSSKKKGGKKGSKSKK